MSLRTEMATDGLRCAKDWPSCIGEADECQRLGCFWRRWHSIPADKLRQSVPVAPQADLFGGEE